jgi:hypothetical protein
VSAALGGSLERTLNITEPLVRHERKPTMAFSTVTDQSKARADSIRLSLDTYCDQTRSDRSASLGAIRSRIASAYLRSKAQMDALQLSSTGASTARLDQLSSAAWGIADLTRGDPASKLTAAISYRDAQDRAASVETVRGAGELLTQATDTGDELLARAVAKRAYDQRVLDTSWEDVLNRYLSSRPKAYAAVAALLDADVRAPRAADLWAFVLPLPPELIGLPDFRIQALADDPAFGASV